MANKVKFFTAYGDRREIFTEPGNPIEDIYGWVIDKYGQKNLEIIGQSNIYDKIQESLEETKIENILQRVVAGDNTVLRPDGIYADLTDSPKNLLEARQQMQKLENLWNKLDPDTKREYDFSVDKFIAASGTEKWLIDMGLIDKPNKPEEIKITETKGAEPSE